MKAATTRIVLNLPELRHFIAHRPIAYKIGDFPIEFVLAQEIGAKDVVAAALDITEPYSADRDPDEAREFMRGHRMTKTPK